VQTRSVDGLTPAEQLAKLMGEAGALMTRQQERWAELRAELAKEGISVLDGEQLSGEDMTFLRTRFLERVFPLLTPLAIDPAHPFPFIPNLGFAIALKLRRREDAKALNALVPVPTQVERFLELPAGEKGENGHVRRRFISLEGAITVFMDLLFPGY